MRKFFDDLVVFLIALAVGLGLVILIMRLSGMSAATLWAGVERFLGISIPLFGAALAFLIWVLAALVGDIAGLTEPRAWNSVARALAYLERVLPYAALTFCFVEIIEGLLAYAAAKGGAEAQPNLIAAVAVALVASAAGSAGALVAHSLRSLVVRRSEGP